MTFRILLVLVLSVRGSAFADIINFEEIVEGELFYENSRIEGRLGKSLVLASGDTFEILDTVDARVSYKTKLSPDSRVWRVSASPRSTVGIIEILYKMDDRNTIRTFIYREHGDKVFEGNKLVPHAHGLYPQSTSPSETRKNDYLISDWVNDRGDLLLTSDRTRNQVVIENFIPANLADIGAKGISGNFTTRYLNFDDDQTKYHCVNTDSTGGTVVRRSGDFYSVSVVEFSGNRLIRQSELLKGKKISQVVVQCINGEDGVMQVLVDASLTEQTELSDIPVRSVRTGENSYDRMTTKSAKSHRVRSFYDGTSELVTLNWLRKNGDSSGFYPTPVARDVFLDILPMKSNGSVLSTLDYKVAIRIPDEAKEVIEYPHPAENRRLYCVFGHRGANITKSCYLAILAE